MIRATLAATALASTSNVLAQFLLAYRKQEPFAFDPAGFLRFVIVTLLTAPPNYMWQQLLERTFPAYEHKGRMSPMSSSSSSKEASSMMRDAEKQEMGLADRDGRDGVHMHGGSVEAAGSGGEVEQKPKLNLRNTLTKWFVDCITLGAIFNTVAFFVLMGFLKRQPLDTIGHNIRTQTIPIIVAGYKIWPFASIISFSCIPVEKRIVFLNFVGLIWGIYMSLVATRV